jgi:hypothetical protein
MSVRVYTLTITADDEVTGLKPGTYVAHVSDDAVTITFKPRNSGTFRPGRTMEEEK